VHVHVFLIVGLFVACIGWMRNIFDPINSDLTQLSNTGDKWEKIKRTLKSKQLFSSSKKPAGVSVFVLTLAKASCLTLCVFCIEYIVLVIF